MKTLLTITILLLTISLNAQTAFEKEYNEIRNTPGMKAVDVQFVRLETVKELKFTDLLDREKWLMLEKIEDAYYTFHKKDINPSTLLIYMKENNPTCEWTGKHVEGEDGKFIRYYTVDRKHILRIFDL